jgi:pyruvate kinase
MAKAHQLFGRTKIICTLGPASGSREAIGAMLRSGMDAVRLNFSHGTHAEHLARLRILRQEAKMAGEPVSVIQDLQGPKIRIGELAAPSVELKPEQQITITTRPVRGDARTLSTTYRHLPKDVKKGDRVLVDDGKIELVVRSSGRNSVELTVVTGGTLTAHKGINLPGVKITAPSLTEKDKEDLEFAVEHGLDYVALSFVRRGADVALLRDLLSRRKRRTPKISIIAKIEKGEAVENIQEIIREADAVMVARGDLGVELPVEDVPLLQKMIVRRCNELGKPVIIATQMLESMIANPMPTRAEASDVANAVLDGADAVMLSGETAIGQYPVTVVQMMDRIIRKTEEQAGAVRGFDPERLPLTHEYDPLSLAACRLAYRLNVSAIVALTHSGLTAERLAKFRPPVRIIAVTDRERVMRRLNLIWGIRGLIVEDLKRDTDGTFGKIEEQLLRDGYVRKGETVVMLAGIPLFEGHPTNTIKVDKIRGA